MIATESAPLCEETAKPTCFAILSVVATRRADTWSEGCWWCFQVDALGGEIGRIADKTYLQKRILNRSKGPAVWALRAQTDKKQYAQEMRTVVEK